MNLFITGTGTGVGKTVITAGLAAAFYRKNRSVCVYKPIQTGSDLKNPEDPTQIKTWLGDDIKTACTYCFTEPVAPLMADQKRQIQSERILMDVEALEKQADVVLIEGAGGVRVPIAPDFDMLDLIKLLKTPVLVVTSPWLGTINHTRLTVDALLQADMPVRGVVVSGLPDAKSPQAKEPAVSGLIEALTAYLPVPMLGGIPCFELTAAGFQEPKVQQAFDGLRDALAR